MSNAENHEIIDTDPLLDTGKAREEARAEIRNALAELRAMNQKILDELQDQKNERKTWTIAFKRGILSILKAIGWID